MAQPILAEVLHMAAHTPSPQVEDGYTKIANELLEAMAAFSFSSRQLKVILALMRKTYGYNKKTDDIGLSQIAKLTNIDKSNLSRTVHDLVEMRVIIRSQGTFGHKLSINKHYSQWGVSNRQPAKPVVKSATPPVVKSATPPVVKSATTKDNPSKDNQPKEKNPLCKPACTTPSSESFLSFWAVWPKKKNKAAAAKAFAKLNPDAALLAVMLQSISAATASADWIKDGGQFIPMAATWLNGEQWENEIQPAVGSFTETQQTFIDSFNENIGSVCQPVADWSQKISDLINLALAGKWDAERWVKYWRYVRDCCEFRGQMSFEWLVSRDNLVKVVRGDFEVAA